MAALPPPRFSFGSFWLTLMRPSGSQASCTRQLLRDLPPVIPGSRPPLRPLALHS